MSRLLALALLVAGCLPQELVLRRSSVDWEGLGVRSVAVEPEPEPIVEPPSTGQATGSAPIVAADPAELERVTREAAELLAFALKQSAVDVRPADAALPRLEVTVKEVVMTEEGAEPIAMEFPGRPNTLLAIRDQGRMGPGPDRLVRATVLARLIDPAAPRPLWFKEAVGTVDIGASRQYALGAADPFPPPSRLDRENEAAALAFYREIALRRALRQIADDLLPRYEYVELKPDRR